MDLKKISALARITLTEDEVQALQRDAQEVIDAFSILDTWKPIDPVVDLAGDEALRTDEVQEGLSQEDALLNVDYSEDGFLIGPQTTQ